MYCKQFVWILFEAFSRLTFINWRWKTVGKNSNIKSPKNTQTKAKAFHLIHEELLITILYLKAWHSELFFIHTAHFKFSNNFGIEECWVMFLLLKLLFLLMHFTTSLEANRLLGSRLSKSIVKIKNLLFYFRQKCFHFFSHAITNWLWFTNRKPQVYFLFFISSVKLSETINWLKVLLRQYALNVSCDWRAMRKSNQICPEIETVFLSENFVWEQLCIQTCYSQQTGTWKPFKSVKTFCF